ncbi:MAG: hypothetical protein ACPGYT_04195 [Nitrospirales bacterium]
MKHSIHPNQFPTLNTMSDEEEGYAGGVKAALKFLEGIDQDDESLRIRRRRQARRTAAAAVSSMAARAYVVR